MNLKDAEEWEKSRANNTDPYGKATLDFAERWAELMEQRTAGDMGLLSSVAKGASHDADIEGITGFMYGCAVNVLAVVWEHGETLRQWHNLDTQIKDEGERANASGGVLNPALLVLSDDPAD